MIKYFWLLACDGCDDNHLYLALPTTRPKYHSTPGQRVVMVERSLVIDTNSVCLGVWSSESISTRCVLRAHCGEGYGFISVS